MPAFFARKRFCHTCKKGYDKLQDHLCGDTCKLCYSQNCPIVSWVRCNDCNRYFKSLECLHKHKQSIGNAKTICDSLVKCCSCQAVIKRSKIRPELHNCGLVRCVVCQKYVDGENHLCYMQADRAKTSRTVDSESGEHLDNEAHEDNEPSEDNQPSENDSAYNQLLFFDFECTQESGTHAPNLCVVHDELGNENIFRGERTKEDFCEWLFRKENAGSIVIAHNFQGYDGYFVLKYLHKQGIVPSVILRGAKLLTINVPMFNIKFIDSLCFIPMKLANFPKTFGMTELAKGYFPHLFNTAENQTYVGPIPPSAFYYPDGMTPSEKEKFLSWHGNLQENNYVFNFQDEILKYCRSDVDILRRCCMDFREMFRDVTGIDPFEKCLTIASACNLVFRRKFLREDTIAIIPPNGYRPRDKHSILALKWLSYTAEQENIVIQHARNAGEKRIGTYRLDGFDEDSNTAYEVQGCFWHGCTKCYSRETVNSVNGRTMHELHQATSEKITYLKSQGLNVVEVWECEINRQLESNPEMKVYFNNYDVVDPLEPREAFYGGRTNAAKLFHECQGAEKINYIDFTSLYPFCNKNTPAVVGHPKIITENFQDVSSYFGLIKCSVLPPRGLFHPVLPYRTQGKLMFPLCKACADTCNQGNCNHSDAERSIQGTWVSVELQKAIEKGYRVLRVHEVWHFENQSSELFKDYVDTFLKIKQESSGYPSECQTEEEKQRYIQQYFEHEGIHLDPSKIERNPGLRALAKLMLNSFWGKFAQRPNMTKVELISDPKVYFDYLSSDGINVLDVNLVSDNVVELHYELDENLVEPSAKTNVVIAAFTTAYARLKLYGVLDMLQERVLYYDTDSVIYLSKPGETEQPTGNYFDDLTNEIEHGDHITTFISGGPKNYCYKTFNGKIETKVRGITLNCTALKKVNFNVIRSLVYLGAECNIKGRVSVDIPFKIIRDKHSKDIVTKRQKKDYQIVYNKRVLINGYNTVPYGF
ncbi:uncharacterized protein LOC114517603 [Dendronephthya gigantea]|uniref:uncharacterized protein LOC114517603 n=1 Tax=Dendronephthya gigantea TaxID=151771 RepID=UPI001069DE77|nr:uncharacterized protein LOC114517603 [Dendronephthya gigantea]